jgi:hypothetical protein
MYNLQLTFSAFRNSIEIKNTTCSVTKVFFIFFSQIKQMVYYRLKLEFKMLSTARPEVLCFVKCPNPIFFYIKIVMYDIVLAMPIKRTLFVFQFDLS